MAWSVPSSTVLALQGAVHMTSFELYTPALTGAETIDGVETIQVVWRDPHETRARRILNVIVASIGIVLTAPIMAVVAALVKLSSPGPILYRQVRVGVDRRNPRLPVGNHRRAIDYGG